MKITDYLEQDREKLTQDLRQAAEPERAVGVIEKELDRLLYRYNDENRNALTMEYAAYLTQMAKMMAPLADSVSESRIWEEPAGRAEEERKARHRERSTMLLAAGVCLLALSLVLTVLLNPRAGLLGVLLPGAAAVAGGVVLYLSGLLLAGGRNRKAADVSRHVENRVDEERVYRTLHSAFLAMDQNMEQMEASLAWQQEHPSEGTAVQEPGQTEAALFGDLLEAFYSKDGAFALERLAELPYYLHRRGVRTVDYSEEDSHLFDRMPGDEDQTVRPALVSGEALLRKGLATAKDK